MQPPDTMATAGLQDAGVSNHPDAALAAMACELVDTGIIVISA